MVYPKSHSRFLHFLGGQCGMEITVLLLLTVPLTIASPLRPTHRSDANAVPSLDTVEAPRAKRSEGAREEHAPAPKIVPFHSDDKHLDLDALRNNMKLRPRRAPQRGCQLGTCQLHHLANTLFHYSKTSGKDESKKAHDPQGYGR